MNIYLDIETIGTEDPEIIAEIAAEIQPPKTMSKPETIAKWEAEEKPALVKAAVGKTAFDGALGKIICIGWKFGGGDAWTRSVVEGATCALNEADVLRAFFDHVRETLEHHHVRATIIGHNIIGFDLRFLWQRAAINGVKPPPCIPFNAKPWDDGVYDTMLRWNPETGKRISLDRLCRALKIQSPKGDMDGSKVWDAYRAREHEKIAEYCARDVEAVAECHRRMTFGA